MSAASDSSVTAEAGGRRSAAILTAVCLAAVLGITACENPLDVQNPNNVAEEDLNTPAAVAPAVNGGLRTTAEAWGWVLSIQATATDEVTWIGSRDAWNQLDQGNITTRTNEFTDVAFPQLAEAVFMTRKAVTLAEQFQGDLNDPRNLPRAYFMAGLSHTILAENFENYAFPEKPTESASPIGQENMDQVFDMAIEFATKAINTAEQVGAADLATRAYALRARVHHQKAIWTMLNPPGSTPSDPLVNNQAAVSDARTVLQRVGTATDWTWNFRYTSATTSNNLGAWMHGRLEMRHARKFAEVAKPDPFKLSGVIQDPITGEADPFVKALITDWLTVQEFVDSPGLSAREMHLILAEANLAQGNTDGLETHINHVRAMDGVTLYDAENPDHPEPMAMLRYERMTDLHLMGRRLVDLYRFGEQASRWQSGNPAASAPGTVFPVTITECRANVNFNCG